MKDCEAYDRISRLAKASGFTRRDIDALYEAYELAQESDFDDCRLGCVIMCGNAIVARGHNCEKSNPTQKIYNLRYREFVKGTYSNREHSVHAELAALASMSYPMQQKINWNKAKAYVYRISPGKPYEQGTAAPCCACAHALADAGVRQVVFSTDYGFASSRIDPDMGLVDGD